MNKRGRKVLLRGRIYPHVWTSKSFYRFVWNLKCGTEDFESHVVKNTSIQRDNNTFGSKESLCSLQPDIFLHFGFPRFQCAITLKQDWKVEEILVPLNDKK